MAKKLSDKELESILEKYSWHNKCELCKCYMCKLIRHIEALEEEKNNA